MLRKGIYSPTDSNTRSAVQEFLIGCSSTGPILGIRMWTVRTVRVLRATKNFILVVARDIADWWNDFWFGSMTYEDHQLVEFWEKLGKENRDERDR